MCSDEFAPLGRVEAQVLGLPGLPLVAVPHPLAGNPQELVRAKGRAIADDVLAALTTEAGALARRHRGRFVRATERRMTGGAGCADDACVVDPGLRGVVALPADRP